MKKNKSVKFIQDLFKTHRSHFDLYFDYLKQIDKDGVKILHLGCGWDKRKIESRINKGSLYSLDKDLSSIRKNINLLKVCGDAACIPFKKRSFDYIICEDFIEHDSDPAKLLNEAGYILKDHGEFIFVTPNGFSYISIISRLTPLGFHKWFNKIRSVDEGDIYPAYYRFNSRRKIEKVLTGSEFKIEKIEFITGYPSYFNFSRILTVIFGYCHYFISKVKFLNNTIGINIFCVLTK